MRDHALIIEKTVEEHINNYFHITEAFETLSWERMLNFSGEYYPEMVKEFYANIRDKNHPLNHIESYVNGVQINITSDLLNQLFNIPAEGPAFRMTSSNTVPADLEYNPLEAQQIFGLRGQLRARDFGQQWIRARLLCYLYSYNIMPRASGINKIRMTDLYFVYKMIFGLGNIPRIPLTHIIIKQMWNVVASQNQDKGFVFPILLSTIFRAQNVPIRDEESRLSHSILDRDTMHHLHYTRDVFVWRIVPGYHREEREEAAQEEAAQDVPVEGEHEERQQQPEPDAQPAMQQQGGQNLNMEYISTQFAQLHTQLAEQRRAFEEHRQFVGRYLWDLRHYHDQLAQHFNFPPPPPFDPSTFFPQQAPPDEGNDDNI